MLRSVVSLTVVFLLAAAGGGCARRAKQKQQPQQRVPQAIQVGTISLVNEAGRFVLIDSGSFPSPPPSATLRSFTGTDESAELMATDVRRRPFIIADIRNGAPRKGDKVFLKRVDALRAEAVNPRPPGTAGAEYPPPPPPPPLNLEESDEPPQVRVQRGAFGAAPE